MKTMTYDVTRTGFGVAKKKILSRHNNKMWHISIGSSKIKCANQLKYVLSPNIIRLYKQTAAVTDIDSSEKEREKKQRPTLLMT